jgi:hypothetical protein
VPVSRAQLQAALTDAFILNDPLRLLRSGAPLDEYADEIDRLTDRWEDAGELTAQDIEHVLSAAFAGVAIDPEIHHRLLAAAQALIKLT